MALYIHYYDQEQVEHKQIVFHVGSGKLALRFSQQAAFFEVQADDHELEKIREQFTNIRMTTNRVVFWKDEDAQFIVDNLKL
jgi:hypothetical protein